MTAKSALKVLSPLTPAQERTAALDSFYDRCEGRNLSLGTLRFYRDKLTAFTRWLARAGYDDLPLAELQPKHLRDFLTEERKRTSPQQARHCYVSLRVFLLEFRQIDVAQHLGVNENSIIAWEMNKSSPNLHYIPRIIAYLGYLPFADIQVQEKPFAEQIILLRQMRGISQATLARQLGINPGTLALWEKRMSLPSPLYSRTINSLLHTTCCVDILCAEVGSESPWRSAADQSVQCLGSAPHDISPGDHIIRMCQQPQFLIEQRQENRCLLIYSRDTQRIKPHWMPTLVVEGDGG